MPSPLGLYLHIPFCRKKCSYCDFNTYAGLESLFQPYTAALCTEIKLLGRAYQRPSIKTIFIGGGTPTVLTAGQLAQILQTVRREFNLDPHAEITTEANPGTINQAYLAKLHNLGINRISFGAQSFNAGELTMLGRIHQAEEIGLSVAAARQAGFDNLNLDLIYGLPQQNLENWQHTLQTAVSQQPQHISLYSLTLEAGTSLRTQVARGELPHPDGDLAAEMYELADVVLAANGYTQYEISNWAKDGQVCRHNLIYWRNQAYLSCGPGAHSSHNGRRWWNYRSVPQYIAQVQQCAADPVSRQQGHPYPSREDFETIDSMLAMRETMILGLRLIHEGVSIPEFSRRFGRSPQAVFNAEITQLKTRHLLQEKEARLLLTPPARLLANQVFVEFL